ncbi:MAG: hypothetical protein AAGC57_12435 [Pseudomonadota bacterium]
MADAFVSLSHKKAQCEAWIKEADAHFAAIDAQLIQLYANLRKNGFDKAMRGTLEALIDQGQVSVKRVMELKTKILKEGKVIEALAQGNFKKAAKASGIVSTEAKAAMGEASGLVGEMAGMAAKLGAAASKMASPTYWRDLLIYPDIEEVDVRIAVTEKGKKILETINRMRRARSFVKTAAKGLLAAVKLRLKSAETRMKASEARLKQLQGRYDELPKLADLKKLAV